MILTGVWNFMNLLRHAKIIFQITLFFLLKLDSNFMEMLMLMPTTAELCHLTSQKILNQKEFHCSILKISRC